MSTMSTMATSPNQTQKFRTRNPPLYHEMVGRHLTEPEKIGGTGGDNGGKQQADTDCTLSSIILNHIDMDR